MAEALGHKWGQIIGDVLEEAVRPPLEAVAAKYGMYLDAKGARPARPGKKLSWRDKYGNSHDLDFVLERGGSATKIGLPVAFIESAWRRYTKHSRNKAQEIEGALIPLRDTYSELSPFLGVILGGVFTAGALAQLTSRGFAVLYVDYQSILDAFGKVGIDAGFEEGTTEEEFRSKLKSWAALSKAQRSKLNKELREASASQSSLFVESLEQRLTRQVKRVLILPLHGSRHSLASIADAVAFVKDYPDEAGTKEALAVYEIEIEYSTGDSVRGSFGARAQALGFLKTFL